MLNPIINKLKHLTTLQIATILTLVVFSIYLNTFTNKLFYDDEDFIYKNEYVKNFNLPKYFSENTIAGSGKLSNYYRPLLTLGYGFEYIIFQDFPFIYHFNSVALQAINTALVFLFIKKLFGRKLIAFITGLMFGIHPIQTEAVSYVSGRGDPLSFMFMLITLIIFAKSNKNFSYFSKSTLISLLAFSCALLSKEITIITPFLILLVDLIREGNLKAKTFKNAVFKTIPYFLILIFYLLLRLTLLNFQNTLNFYNYSNIYSENLFIRMLTFLNLLPEYFKLLIFPWTLYIDRSTTIITSVNLKVIITSILILTSFALSVKFFKKTPILLFAFLWFFICFIPTSGVIPINGIFYEHFLYFPSLGFFLLESYLIVETFKYLKRFLKITIILIFLAYIIFLMSRTVHRNSEWNNPITFYSQTLKHTESARIRNNLAMAYAESGDYKKSIVEYKKSIYFYDFYPETHYNLGNAYLALNQTQNAMDEYEKSIKIDKYFYYPYIKLYELYTKTNDLQSKEALLKKVETLAEVNKTFNSILIQFKN